jgi:hypothetical protein
LPKDGKVLFHLGFESKVLPGPLTDLPCCGLEVQNPTQALKSVEGPGNTLHLNPKWERTLPFFGNFTWDIYRVPSKNPRTRHDSELKFKEYIFLFVNELFFLLSNFNSRHISCSWKNV